MRVTRVFVAAALLASVLTARPAAASDQIIFLVRHAEKAATPPNQPPSKTMMADDPPLNDAGRVRAAKLAAILASADVKHIFTTEFRRTRETAAPLAAKLKLTPVMAASKDPDPLVARIRRIKGNVLIVGHSNTMPDLLKKLGVKEAVTIGDNEYDNLFIVVRPVTGAPTLIRLRF
jgi:broad specificity phosphatase PhoE